MTIQIAPCTICNGCINTFTVFYFKNIYDHHQKKGNSGTQVLVKWEINHNTFQISFCCSGKPKNPSGNLSQLNNLKLFVAALKWIVKVNTQAFVFPGKARTQQFSFRAPFPQPPPHLRTEPPPEVGLARARPLGG